MEGSEFKFQNLRNPYSCIQIVSFMNILDVMYSYNPCLPQIPRTCKYDNLSIYETLYVCAKSVC